MLIGVTLVNGEICLPDGVCASILAFAATESFCYKLQTISLLEQSGSYW